jgi:hypothetical protein
MAAMTAVKSGFPDDRTSRERRKNLSESELEDLELAGGVEGGMQAGSAGGPGQKESEADAGKKRPRP